MDCGPRDGHHGRRRRFASPLPALIGAVALALCACGSLAPAASSSSSSSSSPSSSSSSSQSGGSSSSGGGFDNGSGSGGARGQAPTILSFSAAAHCESRGPNFSTPGQVTLSWATRYDSGVQITSDVGENASYGPSGTVTLGFGCNPTIGKSTTHTYTLTTRGGTGPAARKTVSASAVYNP